MVHGSDYDESGSEEFGLEEFGENEFDDLDYAELFFPTISGLTPVWRHLFEGG